MESNSAEMPKNLTVVCESCGNFPVFFFDNNFWSQIFSTVLIIDPLLEYECQWDIRARVEVFGYIFVRNAVIAVNCYKKFRDCGECGESKYLTAFHRIYRNSPLFFQKFTAFVFQRLINLI